MNVPSVKLDFECRDGVKLAYAVLKSKSKKKR